MGVDLIGEKFLTALAISPGLAASVEGGCHLPPHPPILGLGWDSLGLCCFSKARLGETLGSSLGVKTCLDLPRQK